jgi:UDP-N-acetylmuramoyl-L-alanyl-D-glutamate--2,6-diaminopimelate ligase
MDDPYGQRLFDKTPAALGYGFARHERRKERRVLNGLVLEQSREGLRLRMDFAGEPWELHSPLVGEFNAANLLGVQALALAFGLAPRDFRVLETFNGVPGRLERVPNNRGLAVFVDYAHTPDALQKALLALRGARFERIITVFGCGGNRDRAKRPLMGEAAAALSEVVVLTSDNPRKEEPLAIMADARPGLAKARKLIEEADRKRAIGLALDEMRPGDALLIAGKGHEPYQIIGDTRHPFSDQQVVKELLGCV